MFHMFFRSVNFIAIQEHSAREWELQYRSKTLISMKVYEKLISHTCQFFREIRLFTADQLYTRRFWVALMQFKS